MKRHAKNFCRGLMTFASQIPVLMLILLLSIGGETAWASVTATISGLVRDPSGAVIPGAQVVARNHQTGAAVTVLTDAQGFYSSAGLAGRHLRRRNQQGRF